jgi:hypothetical protein
MQITTHPQSHVVSMCVAVYGEEQKCTKAL